LLRNATTIGFNAVPDTVQSLVQASLESLNRIDRETLEVAATIGQRFNVEHVRRLLETSDYDLSELVVRRLIQSEGVLYIFSHALVRDGVYASILDSRKRDLHSRVASVLGESDLSLRAQHLEQAQSHNAALTYIEDEDFALELCESGISLSNDYDVLLRLLLLKGEVLLNLGCTQDSMETFRRAEDLSITESDSCRALIGLAEGLRIAIHTMMRSPNFIWPRAYPKHCPYSNAPVFFTFVEAFFLLKAILKAALPPTRSR
jgi:tetratricopeptide (TPR) repeat protein